MVWHLSLYVVGWGVVRVTRSAKGSTNSMNGTNKKKARGMMRDKSASTFAHVDGVALVCVEFG